MSHEMQDMWEAMKGPYYQRLLIELRDGMQNSSDLQEMFTLALEKVAKAAHAEAGTLWVHDKFTDGRVRPYAVYGGNAEIGNFSLPYGEGVCGKVIESGKEVFITTKSEGGKWSKKADNTTGFSTKTMICVPIKRGRATFGCIQILNKADGEDFDKVDAAFASDLAREFSEQFSAKDFMAGYENSDVNGKLITNENMSENFGKIFTSKSFADAEDLIRNVPQIKALNENKKKQILRHCREVWMVVNK